MSWKRLESWEFDYESWNIFLIFSIKNWIWKKALHIMTCIFSTYYNNNKSLMPNRFNCVFRESLLISPRKKHTLPNHKHALKTSLRRKPIQISSNLLAFFQTLVFNKFIKKQKMLKNFIYIFYKLVSLFLSFLWLKYFAKCRYWIFLETF